MIQATVVDGRPSFTSCEDIVEMAKRFAQMDEVGRALDLLDNPPGYFKGNEKLEKLKREIYERLFTSFDYTEDAGEEENVSAGWMDGNFNNTKQKLDVVIGEIERLEGAHIVEMCPGHGWLRELLVKKEMKFSYESYSINKKTLDDKRVFDKTIFVSMETIEHLWNPHRELQHWYYKYAYDADSVIVSTPLNTLNGGMESIERDLGHIRTFSQSELIEFCYNVFPKKYMWESLNTMCQIIIGRKQ